LFDAEVMPSPLWFYAKVVDDGRGSTAGM